MQDGREAFQLKIVKDRIEMRRLFDKALFPCVVQISDEATARHGGVDFERGGEDHVTIRQARSAFALHRLNDVAAKIMEQLLKQGFLLRLCFVVGRPVLLVGDALRNLDRFGCRGRGCVTVYGCGRAALTFKCVLNRIDVLAFRFALLKVWTGATL